MPYRRLPNTDAARIKAMKIALEKGKEIPPYLMAFSSKNIVRLQRFLPMFEHNIQLQRQMQITQNKRGKNYYELQHKAKVYLTHFIRVMNMAITRGELSKETRLFYGFDMEDSNVPLFATETELINWGHKVIEGEEKRLLGGGSPITNPTIAVVKVWFEKFIDTYNYHKTLAKRVSDYSDKTCDMRKEADELIQDVWNEIETSLKDLPDDKRKAECESYGIVYFYRKGELEKISIKNDIAANRWN